MNFEKNTKSLFQRNYETYALLEIIHDKKIKNKDQNYQIDVYYEFEQAEVNFKVLVERKNHNASIKLDYVQVSYSKLQELVCSKGVLVSTSGFQKGAITFAKDKDIALIRILKDEVIYETRHLTNIDLKGLLKSPVDQYRFQKIQFKVDQIISSNQINDQNDLV